MNLVRLQDTKLMNRNLLHSYTLMMKNLKEKLRKYSHLPPQAKEYNTWIESVIRTLVLIFTYQNSAIEIVYKDETVSQYEPGPLQNYNHKIAVSKHAQNNRIRTFEVTILFLFFYFFLNNKPLSRMCVCVCQSQPSWKTVPAAALQL